MTTGQAIDPTLRTLRTTGPLLERLLEQVTGLRARPDGPAGTAWEAPLPLNEQAFDDANDLFEVLVTTVEYEAAWLDEPAPPLNRVIWRNASGHVVGFRAGITPRQARAAAHELTHWLEARLSLLGENAIDPLLWTIRAKAARYPYSDRPTTSKTAVCPDCTGSLLVYPPRFDGDAERVTCKACGLELDEAEYARTEHRYQGLLIAARRAAKVTRHLTRRHTAPQVTA